MIAIRRGLWGRFGHRRPRTDRARIATVLC